MQAATHSPLYVSDERACIIIHLDSCKASSFRELSLNCLIQPWVADAMEEVSPAHSRTSKYASFSPSRKEEDQTKVGTVEITYVDPVSQTLSNMDVFLDPDSWSGKANEMRFLISADLVNLVSESHAARQARFRTREHSTLRLEPTTPLMLMCDTSHDAQSGVDMWHCQVSTTPQSEILFLILTSNKSQNCFLSLQHVGIVPPQPIQWLQLCNSDQLHIFSFPAIGKRRRDWSKRAWFFLWTFGNSGGWLSEWHWQLMNLKVLQVSPQRHATFISLWLSYVWDLGIPLFVCVCAPLLLQKCTWVVFEWFWISCGFHFLWWTLSLLLMLLLVVILRLTSLAWHILRCQRQGTVWNGQFHHSTCVLESLFFWATGQASWHSRSFCIAWNGLVLFPINPFYMKVCCYTQSRYQSSTLMITPWNVWNVPATFSWSICLMRCARCKNV